VGGDSEGEDEEVIWESEEHPIEVGDPIELSLNSVVGLTTPGTMKLKGIVAGSEVAVLIDCGAIHNFISLKLVQDLDLPTTATTNYGVVMGSGKAIQGKGKCKGVVLEMQGLTVVEDFLPLELGSIDVVFGM